MKTLYYLTFDKRYSEFGFQVIRALKKLNYAL